ncbi:MAG TPA: helix-turn-helix domain-containing protein, partial [Guyparkeria sp.]|nr:helix-turn-helix domain-containing protein [Guyparkeria sp.]
MVAGAKHLSPDELNKRRRQAVGLRLDGHTVEETSRRCGLSTPTVSAAFKAFREGGWSGVDLRPRGRPAGQGRTISMPVGRRLSARLMSGPDASTPLWGLRQVQAWLADKEGVVPSERALRRWLDEQLGIGSTAAAGPGHRPDRRPGRRWLERLRERGGLSFEIRVDWM